MSVPLPDLAFERMMRRVSGGLGAVAVALTLAQLGVVLWQVASRYLLGRPSVVTEDLAQILLPWLGLIGAAWTYGQGQQLSIDLLMPALRGRAARRLAIAIRIAALVFALGVMVIGGGRYALERFERGQRTEILGAPVALIYLAVPVSGLFITLFALSDIAAAASGLRVAGMIGDDEGTAP